MSHFPEVDRLEQVLRAWPKIFAKPPVGTQPLSLDESTLTVLCQTSDAAALIADEANRIIGLLNPLLDGQVTLTNINAVRASATEIYLAREVLELKLWLRDFDVGF